MRARPIREPALCEELARRVIRDYPGRARLIIDGAPPARPDALADSLATRLRVEGRPTLRVSARDFLRPASIRLEHGHTDADALLSSWLDESGLRREVLKPAGPHGSRSVLPRLWDTTVERAFRTNRVELASNGVLILDGSLLLGRGLPAELTVHIRLSDAALARRTEPELRWTLPAYERYNRESNPANADVLVLADDPVRLALVDDR
ncbi:MAG: uridine kinase [Pseudonocardia sp.]|nr:uridine kinase [Pseudonocardia sp.]